jgi:hypothetical protein
MVLGRVSRTTTATVTSTGQPTLHARIKQEISNAPSKSQYRMNMPVYWNCYKCVISTQTSSKGHNVLHYTHSRLYSARSRVFELHRTAVINVTVVPTDPDATTYDHQWGPHLPIRVKPVSKVNSIKAIRHLTPQLKIKNVLPYTEHKLGHWRTIRVRISLRYHFFATQDSTNDWKQKTSKTDLLTAWLTLYPENGGDIILRKARSRQQTELICLLPVSCWCVCVPPTSRLTFSRLHKTKLFLEDIIGRSYHLGIKILYYWLCNVYLQCIKLLMWTCIADLTGITNVSTESYLPI